MAVHRDARSLALLVAPLARQTLLAVHEGHTEITLDALTNAIALPSADHLIFMLYQIGIRASGAQRPGFLHPAEDPQLFTVTTFRTERLARLRNDLAAEVKTAWHRKITASAARRSAIPSLPLRMLTANEKILVLAADLTSTDAGDVVEMLLLYGSRNASLALPRNPAALASFVEDVALPVANACLTVDGRVALTAYTVIGRKCTFYIDEVAYDGRTAIRPFGHICRVSWGTMRGAG